MVKVRRQMGEGGMARKGRGHQTPAPTSGKDIVTVVAQYNVRSTPGRAGLCGSSGVDATGHVFICHAHTWLHSVSVCPSLRYRSHFTRGMSPHLCALEGFFLLQ